MAALATLFAGAAIAGCSSNAGQQPSDEQGPVIGKIGAELLLGTVQIDSVNYRLRNAGTGYDSGVVNVPTPGMASTFTHLITGVPAAAGYDLVFTATSVDSVYTCNGQAMPTPFSVTANQTTLQTVHLNCKKNANTNGKILVNGTLNACPSIDNIVASTDSADVGDDITLTATAADPDTAPSPLAFSYALATVQPSGAGTGTLAMANTANATFTCDTPGPVAIELTVDDGDADCDNDAFQIVVICTGADACEGITCPPAADACHVAGTCDHVTGNCSAPTTKPAGTSCADSDMCNGAETCNASGVCGGGTAVMCTTAPVCHVLAGAMCAPADGMCSYPNAADGTACTGGTCTGGACIPTVNMCTGLPPCTAGVCQIAGTCAPATGVCSPATQAPDGTPCAGGACTGGVCSPVLSACDSCEAVPHSGNNNCPNTNALCNNIMGSTTAAASTGAGVPAIPAETYAQACRDLLDCYHSTGCAGDGSTYTDCLCGVGNDPNECFGGTLAAAPGLCKAEIVAAANTQSMATIATRFDSTEFPVGIANQMAASCDQFFCSAECNGGGK